MSIEEPSRDRYYNNLKGQHFMWQGHKRCPKENEFYLSDDCAAVYKAECDLNREYYIVVEIGSRRKDYLDLMSGVKSLIRSSSDTTLLIKLGEVLKLLSECANLSCKD